MSDTFRGQSRGPLKSSVISVSCASRAGVRLSSLCWRIEEEKAGNTGRNATPTGSRQQHGLWGRRCAWRQWGREDRTPKGWERLGEEGEVLTQSWGRQPPARAAGRCRVNTCPVFVQAERRPDPAESGGGPLRLLRFLPLLPCPLPPATRPERRRARPRAQFTPGAGAPRQKARRRRSPRCSSLSAPAPAATAATLAASSSASKRRFLQPGKVLCQESSGRDWPGPCSPGSPAGARAQPAVRGERGVPSCPGTGSRPWGRFDSPRWEGLWRWAECEAGDAAGETEVVREKLGFSGRFLQLDSGISAAGATRWGPGPGSVAPGPASRPPPRRPLPRPLPARAVRPSRKSAQLQVGTQRRVCLCRLSPRGLRSAGWEERGWNPPELLHCGLLTP